MPLGEKKHAHFFFLRHKIFSGQTTKGWVPPPPQTPLVVLKQNFFLQLFLFAWKWSKIVRKCINEDNKNIFLINFLVFHVFLKKNFLVVQGVFPIPPRLVVRPLKEFFYVSSPSISNINRRLIFNNTVFSKIYN